MRSVLKTNRRFRNDRLIVTSSRARNHKLPSQKPLSGYRKNPSDTRVTLQKPQDDHARPCKIQLDDKAALCANIFPVVSTHHLGERKKNFLVT